MSRSFPNTTLSGWQTIETLPEYDGFVIAYKPFPEPHGTQMVWDSKALLRNINTAGPDFLKMYPTHWQPLPEPPESVS